MNFTDIDNDKLKELAKDKNTLLIDIRTKEEFEESHIKNAINIPLHDLMYNIDEIEDFKEKNIIVYCRSG
ncbi:rhodanese-like domain-containing protein, partial [Acinetobacter sp. RIT592]